MTLLDAINTFNNILFWLLLYVLLWNGYILLFNRGVPNIRTAPAIRKKIISLLKDDAQKSGKTPYTIVDLGAGNGKFTRQIARALPQARVVGVETDNIAFRWAAFFKKLSGLNNLEYQKMDFYDFDLSIADAVVLYLTIYDMGRIGEKLNRDLKKGTLVTSNRFQLGDGRTQVESGDVRTLYPHQKTLHIYRK